LWVDALAEPFASLTREERKTLDAFVKFVKAEAGGTK